MSIEDPGPALGFNFEESGWERPQRKTQHTLFADSTERSLAAAGITSDEANDWFEWGWLSCMPAFLDAVDELAWTELLFVRDMARSNIPHAAMSAMLKQLPKPLLYDPCRIAYSFRYGWVELPTRRPLTTDPGYWSVDIVRRWVEIAARSGQRSDLHQLFEAVSRALDVVDSE